MHTVLAIDLGASTGRVVAISLDGNKLKCEEVHRFVTPHISEGGFDRWDCDALISQIQKGIAKAPPAASAGVDSWGVDFGLLNEVGKLIANPICYRDRSHLVGFDAFRVALDARTHYSRVGIQPLPFNTASQLMARNLRKDKELDRAAKLAFMPDLIAGLLAGVQPQSSEATIASTSEMLGLNGEWDSEVLDALGVPMSLFSPIRAAKALIGPSKSGLGYVTVASHDTASAVVACPATGNDWAFISSGTWSIVGIELRSHVATEAAMNANFSNEGGYDGTTRFLKNCSGLWLLQQSQQGRDTNQCVAMATTAKPFGSKFDTNDPSLLNPENMPSAIRQLANSPIQTEGTLYRAIFENLAVSYALIIRQIEAISGQAINQIHLVGGGSQNELLNQMTADATGKPVLAGPAEATALGNALVQFEALGVIKDARLEGRALVRGSETLKLYEPANQEAWNEWIGR
jgi:rhamnulokinase